MKKYILYNFLLFAAIIGFSACEKTEYQFGEIKTPSGLTLTTTVAGVNATNPNGNGTGNVSITATATNAITYKFDFGDGIVQMVPSGTINYKYANPGTAEYTITISAIGTGGAVSTISKKVTVFVAFEIPANIVSALTNGSSKVWVTNKDVPAHFGVGPVASFSPDWYQAGPNERDACAYDDEITFSKDASNNIYMQIDNKGQSFSIGAATGFYGFGGGDACLTFAVPENKKLIFMNATSASTPDVSTRIQFTVPGNGIINFGTGGNTYEILSITNNEIFLRNIGIDGNAWYQKLK
ncbi:MAG: PKD domain-containing protein, partial [Chitinophagaceae bacterium]